MNRTIKEATVKRYHYDSRDQLRQHLGDFVAAYNFGRRLETLKGLIPHETVCKAGQSETARFASNPQHQMPGSYTLALLWQSRFVGGYQLLITVRAVH
ncbi:hypothetical protein QE379_002608 [Sphingomonas sp. SORGH_AS 879]|nr:hypothetical protein [Sphingomonas sp. SORGH_AS_0879]